MWTDSPGSGPSNVLVEQLNIPRTPVRPRARDDRVRRRGFITLLAGAAVWPLAARAQLGERMQRIGALMSTRAGDPLGEARLAAFLHGLRSLGWAEGRNARIDVRWTAGNADDIRKYATELVSLMPEVILASGGSVVGPLLQITRTIPVVFTQTPDPVAAGFVASLARPSGNATGFTQVEYGTGAKWLELLKEIAPRVMRAAVLRDPGIPEGIGQFAVIQGVAPSLAMEVSPVDIRDAGEIERAVTHFAHSANGGLIVTSSGLANVHRDLIIGLAAKLRLPAVYSFRFFASAGGLISYGSDSIDPHRSAAGYVDRILKGEKPADLPVQGPTKYELVINLKTAKSLDLTVPQALLARADEVIE
jgi:putative ABC transport system substrate-binding protein